MVSFQLKMKSVGAYFKFTPGFSICAAKNKHKFHLKRQVLLVSKIFLCTNRHIKEIKKPIHVNNNFITAGFIYEYDNFTQ